MLKRFLVAFLTVLIFPAVVFAQGRGPMSEAEQLGTLAGVAAACHPGQALQDFEEIASRLIANKSPSTAVEDYQVKMYAMAKAVAYKNQTDNPQDCRTFVPQFLQMPIFRFELYEDGSLKTDSGNYMLPRGKKQFDPSVKRIYPAAKNVSVMQKTAVQKRAQPNVATSFAGKTQASASTAARPFENKMRPFKSNMRPVTNKMQPVTNNMRPVMTERSF